MPKYKHQYKVRAYNLDYKPGETDLQYYKRLAKVADQRLVRLEQLSKVEGFEKVKSFAYDRAMRDLEAYGGGTRFNTKPPVNAAGEIDQRLLSEKLADMRTFISSVTSTKKGIEAVFSERAKTFNQEFGTSYTWQDLADYYQSGDASRAAKRIPASNTTQRAIGIVQAARKQAEKEMAQNKKITINKQDRVVYEKARELLKSGDLDLSILKGTDKEVRARMEQIIFEYEQEQFK